MAEVSSEKTESAEIGRVKVALAELANQGFIKFPVAAVYVGRFMDELAAEYVKLRKNSPDGDKFETLKAAIENTRATTSNTLLNSEMVPEASKISLMKEAPGLFGKRSIDKYLEKLA